MSNPYWMLLKRSVSVFAAMAVCAACSALAAPAAVSGASSASESSSSLPALSFADGMAPMPAAGYGKDNHYGQDKWKNKLARGYALEFGGGFNAPTSDSSPYITWGGNFTVGAGYNFSPRFAVLAEYQFIDSKLPGGLIGSTYSSTYDDAANGGNAHIWSFGLEPVISLFPKRANDLYVTGGGGFYRKMTNFTYPEVGLYCDDYYGCGYETSNQVVGHFSTNQGGVNIGLGYQRRLGGEFHDSRMKLFAEARYLHVFSPAGTYSVNPYLNPVTVGKGTEIIPVTFGIRW